MEGAKGRKKRRGGMGQVGGRGPVSSLGGLKVMYVRPWAGCGGLTRPLSNNCRQERTKGERQRLRQNCNSISRTEKMNPG